MPKVKQEKQDWKVLHQTLDGKIYDSVDKLPPIPRDHAYFRVVIGIAQNTLEGVN